MKISKMLKDIKSKHGEDVFIYETVTGNLKQINVHAVKGPVEDWRYYYIIGHDDEMMSMTTYQAIAYMG